MSVLSVVIVSPKGVLYEGDVSEAYFPCEKGPLGILPGHTPYIAPLASSGIAKLLVDSRRLYFVLEGGAVEVRPDKTVCMTLKGESAATEEEAKEKLAALRSEKGRTMA